MLLIAGLGNPGAKHAADRHNIGFMAADAIARRWRFGPERARFHSLAAEGSIDLPGGGAERALLLKPQTWMNDSGRAIGEAMRFYKLQPAQVVVFYDEIDMAPGRFRMKIGGGAAGHNGVRSTIAAIGPEFRRARLGVGHPGCKDLVHGYVLNPFAKAEQPWVQALLEACADALPFLAAGEDARYQAEVMRLAPAPKADPRRRPATD